MLSMNKRYLILEDNTVFEGIGFGYDKETTGEVVFTTGMVGYPEGLTDPSYQGQILTFTYPLIGNYGVPTNTNLFESNGIKVRAVIVSKNISDDSHWQARQSFDTWLTKEEIPGIEGIDTRMLTVKLRKKGAMLGKISKSSDPVSSFADPNKENLVSKVSTSKKETYGKGKKTILLIDCGVKQGIIDSLVKRNVRVVKVPWDFDPFKKEASQTLNFDGVIISNGPGDPKIVTNTISTVKKLLDKKIPLLGICLGNQILALSIGADTYKMKFGHRSHNQPVLMKETNRCFLTTQNHGFVVNTKTLPNNWNVWFENLNDGTNEGIRHKKLPFMSVQFHPEGRPGPYDTNFIFDEFLTYV